MPLFRPLVARRTIIACAALALAASSPSFAVSSGAPLNTSLPAVSGTAAVGQTLSTSTGTWTATPAVPDPSGYAYQWQSCEPGYVAGATWTSRASAADNEWRSVAWGGPPGQKTFVAVARSGTGNRVMTSPDGITWASRAAAVDSDWVSVAWGGPAGQQKFVAVAQQTGGTNPMTSPDGINWTSQTGVNRQWASVTWGGPAGNRRFVAVGRVASGSDPGPVMTSPDGITWTEHAAPIRQWRSVAWGGPPGQEKYVAVARLGAIDQRVMTSPDGVTWSLGTTPSVDLDWRSVTWGGPAGNQRFVAVSRVDSSTGSDQIMTSPDGITWTLGKAASSQEWESVTWGGPPGQEQFVAVGNGSEGNLVMTSTDGVTWVLRQSAPGTSWNAVTWGGPAGDEGLVAVGSAGVGNRVMTSAGTDCTSIRSATSSSYTVQAADLQKQLRSRVTASNGILADGVAYSAPTALVAAASPTSPQAATGTAALSARLLPQRTRLVSGQRMRVGIRVVNTGAAAASGVTSCIRLPSNMAIVRSGSALRSGRTVCFRLGDISAGSQATRVVTVRGASVRTVRRTITGTARERGQARVSAPAKSVTIRPRAARARVTG